MNAAVSHPISPAVPHQRAVGEARLTVQRIGDRTRIARLHQAGTAKLRFPRTDDEGACEAVLINTGGGMTGGDRFASAIELGAGAEALVTTQACEKIYRASADRAGVTTRLRVGEAARLEWLPQETILFEGGRLERRIEADLAADATLLALEAVILGRTARGETVEHGLLAEHWRVQRAGRLLWADGWRLDGALAQQAASPRLLGGARAYATVLLVAPEAERDLFVSRARELDAGEGVGSALAASTWNGVAVARFVSSDAFTLRRDLVTFFGHMRRGALPRVWTC